MKNKKLLIGIPIALLIILIIVSVYVGMNYMGKENGTMKNISVEVIYADESSEVFNIETKAETLGEALKGYNLISGTQGEYGLFITKVNGVKVNPDNQEWWRVTRNGEDIEKGVDQIKVEDGDEICLIFTIGYEDGSSENSSSEFFDKYVDTDSRAIAVMIDNDDDSARPQAGLEKAYLTYEIVVEGGASRYMAIFKNDEIDKIGPVRSSRHYFLDYVLENNAVYVHYGWSPKAQNDIPALGINNINGVAGDGGVFWRDNSVTTAWHTAYTSTENINKAISSKGYPDKNEKGNVFLYSPENYDIEDGITANEIIVDYKTSYSTQYVYNAESGLYEKRVNYNDYVMQSGNKIFVKNIIIQYAANYSLGDGSARQNVDTVGSGSGYFITNGKAEPITWQKSSREAKTRYTTREGEEISLNPGSTFVNIIASESMTAIK